MVHITAFANSNANASVNPASAESIPGISTIMIDTILEKNDPTSAMRHPIHRLNNHRCHVAAEKSSILLYMRSM
jgi:hypothetical protein